MSQDIDVFIIVEADLVSKDLDRFIFPGYYLKLLFKSKSVADGTLISIKNTFNSSFEIVNDLSLDNGAEIVCVYVWIHQIILKFMAAIVILIIVD